MIPKNIADLRKDIIIKTDLRGFPLELHSTWGLFSPKEVDEGSRMLIEELQLAPTDTSLDIGSGYGPIGLTMAKMSPQGSVHMVDKDFVAVEFAQKNAQINGLSNCNIYLSNAFSKVPENTQFDVIVSNLPAKVGNELLYLIMSDAKAHLRPGGKLYVVVIAGLKDYIKRNFKEIFGNYKRLAIGKTYMVAVAEKE